MKGSVAHRASVGRDVPAQAKFRALITTMEIYYLDLYDVPMDQRGFFRGRAVCPKLVQRSAKSPVSPEYGDAGARWWEGTAATC